MAVKNLTIRIDDAMLDKLHVIADYEVAPPTAKC